MSSDFKELHAHRLSVTSRGVLWTLLNLEGLLIKESVLDTICPNAIWIQAAKEIRQCGIGRLDCVDQLQRVYRFVHFFTPEERRRIYQREHKQKSRKHQEDQDVK